jgi:glutathione S-transferase
MHSGFSALRTHMPMNLRAALPGRGRTPEVADDIERIQDLWQDCRERYGQGGAFLFGEFSAADAFFAPVVTRFVTYEVALSDTGADYRDAILGLPAMQQWYAAGVLEPERIAASEPYGQP